jgi:hypothetical protein
MWKAGPDGSWSADLAFQDCDADLAKIQSLGIKWVRLGAPWYQMAEAHQALHPDKNAFLIKLLSSARARGLHVLFQVALEAPYGAYSCRQHPPASVWPSQRLDFCDDAFESYVSELVDTVAPYAHHFELFNEVNWGYDSVYGSAFPYQDYAALSTADYVSGRMKGLQSAFAHIMAAKQSVSFQPAIHSTGISYFCSAAAGECPGTDRLTDASSFVYWLFNGWQPSASENVLRDDIDVVDMHPYFDHTIYSQRMTDFVSTLHAMVPSKAVWATETAGSLNNDADLAQVFAQDTALAQQGVIQRFFWYVLRDATGNSENSSYAIYDKNWNVIKPQLLQAILAATRAQI